MSLETPNLRWILHNAYQELYSYCIFLHHAYEAVLLDRATDPSAFTGASISGRCLANRSEEIGRCLGEMLEGGEKEI